MPQGKPPHTQSGPRLALQFSCSSGYTKVLIPSRPPRVKINAAVRDAWYLWDSCIVGYGIPPLVSSKLARITRRLPTAVGTMKKTKIRSIVQYTKCQWNEPEDSCIIFGVLWIIHPPVQYYGTAKRLLLLPFLVDDTPRERIANPPQTLVQ